MIIVGLDEVGRGSWAGPLVVGAVAYDADFSHSLLIDSKKLTLAKRLEASEVIKRHALDISLAWIHPNFLDKHGLSKSIAQAMKTAVDSLSIDFDEVIVDGNINYLKDVENSRFEIRADDRFACVSSASILAKVSRDNYMKTIARKYPEYGFDSHVGYGTKQHSQALEQFGVTKLHRRSFKPVARLLR